MSGKSSGDMTTSSEYPLGGADAGTYKEKDSWLRSSGCSRICLPEASALLRSSAMVSGLKLRRAISSLPERDEYSVKTTFSCAPVILSAA